MLRTLLIGLSILALAVAVVGCEQSVPANSEPPDGLPDLPGDTCSESDVPGKACYRPRATPLDEDEPDEDEPDEDEPGQPASLDGFQVGVYAGAGTCPAGLMAIGNFLDHYDADWSRFSVTDLSELDRFDLVWFPGGFSAEYRRGISDHAAIRDFVADGGRFIGVCAGAYYASATVVWDDGEFHYPLGLFEGRAVGPLSDQFYWGQPVTLSLDQDHPANLGSGPVLDTYYMDGPHFVPVSDQEITVIARYEPGGQLAIIGIELDAGRVMLLGTHPEFGYSDQAGDFTVDGEGAAWLWLLSALLWLMD